MTCPSSSIVYVGLAGVSSRSILKIEFFYQTEFQSLSTLVNLCSFSKHKPLAQFFFWWVRPYYMTGHRRSALSSCRGHRLPAQHYFRRLCPKIWLGIRSPQFSHVVDNSPQVHEIVESYFFRVSFLPPRLETRFPNVIGCLKFMRTIFRATSQWLNPPLLSKPQQRYLHFQRIPQK